jgi:carbon storage regulator
MLANCPRPHYRDGWRPSLSRTGPRFFQSRSAGYQGRVPQIAPLGGALLRHGEAVVLVVSRKVGERILIGDKIAITVVKVSGGGVRIGIEAPAEMAVMREELAEEIRKAERAAMETSDFSQRTHG